MDVSDLRLSAEKLVHDIQVDDRLPVSCLSEETVNRLSIQTSLGDIVEVIPSIESSSSAKIHEIIVWAEGLLRNPHGIVQDSRTVDAAVATQKWITEALTPPKTFAPRSHTDPSIAPQDSHRISLMQTDPTFDVTAIDISRWSLMAVAGLRLLSHLTRLVPSLYESPLQGLVTSLASFTDSRDPWTRSEASGTANALLLDVLGRASATDPMALSKLLASLLQDRVKPSFTKTKNPSITEQGRKANYRQLDVMDFSNSEVELKPWKFRDVYIMTVFRWILGKLDVCSPIFYHVKADVKQETQIQEHWPLVIPPLMAVLDDEAISNKVKGCELLVTILKHTPSSLLQKTGIGEIFQDVLMPCLSYLPSLTSEEESVCLLDAVYPTLLVLLRTRFPGYEPTAKRMATLDQILRVGILHGFSQAGEYVKIATVLMYTLSELIEEMGIMSVSHLKDLLPIVSGILSSPFGPAHPRLLLAAALALQAIILNNWPRISYYRGEVLKGLAICWCTINEDTRKSNDLDNVKIAVRQDIRLLRESVGTNIVELVDVDQLLRGDPQLSDLLITGNQCG
ncbi:hypothetical protein MMC18_009651 [Xylographa bjoerkii]|nr:hypothetical protein [Xylographa bjoerkii]